MNKIFIIFYLFIFLFSKTVLSEQIFYTTGSLKLACIESAGTEVANYADGICFGYTRANIEFLFLEELVCQELLNRDDDFDDYVDLIIDNLKFADDNELPIVYIQDILLKYFC